MLDIMYEIPSKQNVKECIIDDKVIRGEAEPQLIFGTPSSKKPESTKDKDKGTGSAESA
jgi:ATP-dependent Clp protease ATP-binding subunit ClpX